jgi:hypothetical protein
MKRVRDVWDELPMEDEDGGTRDVCEECMATDCKREDKRIG